MEKFIALYGGYVDAESTRGTVIYSADDYSSYKDYEHENFHNIDSLFKNTERTSQSPFVLDC